MTPDVTITEAEAEFRAIVDALTAASQVRPVTETHAVGIVGRLADAALVWLDLNGDRAKVDRRGTVAMLAGMGGWYTARRMFIPDAMTAARDDLIRAEQISAVKDGRWPNTPRRAYWSAKVRELRSEVDMLTGVWASLQGWS